MTYNNIKSIVNIIDDLINDIERNVIKSYILKTRIDRISIRLEDLKKEICIEDIKKLEFQLKHNGGGAYGTGGYVVNLENLVKELKLMKSILLNIE